MKPVYEGMSKEEITQAEKVLRDYFTELKERENRKPIQFFYRRPIEQSEILKQYQYEKKVEEFITSNATLMRTFKIMPTPVDITDGRWFGTDVKVYEVKGKGVVIYDDALVIDNSYVASAQLVGFDEETESFKGFKSQLETLSREGHIPH